MFISKFLGDTNFGLALLTLHVYLIINYNDKLDHFKISDGDRLNRFENILQYNDEKFTTVVIVHKV